MAAIRMIGTRNQLGEQLSPGDVMLVPDVFSNLATVGAATIPAASMITGALNRTGSTAGYTDTFDSASNLLVAMTGNLPAASVIPGLSWKLRILNTVAFLETITLGTGMVAGVGTIASVPVSSWRDFLFTFTSVQIPVSNVANTVNGSAVLTWYLLPGQTAEPQGVSPLSVNIVPGASITGTGIPAGTTVIGITQGQGGTLGLVMSANATATGTVSVTLGPTVTVSSLGSGTL